MENKQIYQTTSQEKEFTDMYLVAALLAYGFDLVSSNRKNANRQKFLFKNEVKSIYVIIDQEAVTEYGNLDDVEIYYLSKRLLFPGSYTDILKGLKQDIISYKHDDNQ